jgi:hypothetical protein
LLVLVVVESAGVNEREVVMRRASYTLALAIIGVLVLPCTPVSAQSYSQRHSGAQVDVSIFYDGLSSDGDWVEMPDYGWSWAPRVERGWRPYTRGQWVNTDDGWYWDSDERFGWAAYHYGRWVNDRYYGWVWVPGTEWAPAWVSWRHVNRGVYQQVLPPAQNVTIINVTNNVTNYTVVNERVVDRGIAVANVERAVGRPVPRARTVDVGRADAPRSASVGEVAVFRPVVNAAPARRPAQGKSLVKGEEPPPLLVERRREREVERQQKGNEPVVTAKDAQERRPAGQAADTKGTAVKPQAHRDPKAQRPETQRQGDQAQQDAAKQRQEKVDAKAQQDRRATDAQQAQKQGQQRQANQQEANQQQADQQRKKQASDADAKAQQDRRATDAQQAQKPNDQADQKQADQQRAKAAQQQAKDNPKDKGKKEPKTSPAPPPAGQ